MISELVEEVEITKGAKITTISGKVTAGGDAPVTSLYAELNGREYPTQADKDGKFSLSLANSDIAERSEIMLTLADEESAVRYKAMKIPAIGGAE